VRVGGRVASILLGDQPIAHQLDQRLVERLHPVELALGDDLHDRGRRGRVDDPLAHAAVVDQGFHRGDPALAVGPGDQPLRDRAAERRGQREPGLSLRRRREEVEHPVDGLGGIDRVHRRDHEVTGLRRGQRGLGGLAVADLAEEDDVGILPDHVSQRGPEGIRVHADLTLVDDRPSILVHDLDGVFDGHDVRSPRLVDVSDHRGDGRGLAGPGRPGHEDQTAGGLREIPHDGGQAELLERRTVGPNAPDRQRHLATLPETVHAEPPDPRHREPGVRLVGFLELRDLANGEKLGDEHLGVARRERRVGARVQLAVHANEGRRPRPQMQIGGAHLDHESQ
jgi:hypothetical protein